MSVEAGLVKDCLWKEEKQKRDTVDQRPKRGRKEKGKDVNLSLKYEQFIASFFFLLLLYLDSSPLPALDRGDSHVTTEFNTTIDDLCVFNNLISALHQFSSAQLKLSVSNKLSL